jgi:hypothetical protein
MSEEGDRLAMLSDVRTVEIRLNGRMDDLENCLVAHINASAEDTRRHFDVVAEKMRTDLKVVIEKTVALDEKVDTLIASNAAEHAAFVDAIMDHDVRLRVLEKIHDLSKPANS